MMRKTDGYTLVELLVSILCCSIVTLATLSFLLLGVRMTGESNNTAAQQQTSRILLTMVERLASSGELSAPTEHESWEIRSKTDSSVIILAYSATDHTLSSGGTVMMEGVTEAKAEVTQKQTDGTCLLTFSFSTERGDTYKTAVCSRIPGSTVETTSVSYEAEATKVADFRTSIEQQLSLSGTETVQDGNNESTSTLTAAQQRGILLLTLASQHGSTGEIKNSAENEYTYFSEWYIGGYDGKPGWNQNTAWCACFVSWAIEQNKDYLSGTIPRFCGVYDGVAKFKNGTFGTWKESDPFPGDLVFFDWAGGNDPDHVGVVLSVEDGTVYTIEGNSNDRVALRAYPLNSACIMGYGVLNWTGGN